MRDIEPVIAIHPHALIMSDPGLIMLVRDRFPDQTIHLSVQANVVNYAAAEFWYRQGIKRIILSRELSITEIGEFRSACPDLEIETFAAHRVHRRLPYQGRWYGSPFMTLTARYSETLKSQTYFRHRLQATAQRQAIALRTPAR